ncbi:hypothetical protein Patl1_13033 [Pistacia atlantica]|uniref:Uncharacterized protein n=1 Tax=Pistacia atlantica TaxID=434234 RepID=A0ACC1AYI5_9ROSI|nr:hypothetical protein Patl1_13033 [Pistacia atlantica]
MRDPKGDRHQTCASCCHRRRPCHPDCLFALYFPANQRNTYERIIKLYPFSKLKEAMTKTIPESERSDSVKSFKFDAYMRARYPVDGYRRIQLGYFRAKDSRYGTGNVGQEGIVPMNQPANEYVMVLDFFVPDFQESASE